MKKSSICDIPVCEAVKSREISALRVKDTSSYDQATTSRPYKQDCCRSLSFGWV